MFGLTYDQLCKRIDEVRAECRQYASLTEKDDDKIWEALELENEFRQLMERKQYFIAQKGLKEYVNAPPVTTTTQRDGRRTDTLYYFITINPPLETPILDFIKSVHRFCRLKACVEAYYCFEQRGKTEGDYTGVHTHMLIKRGLKPSAFKKELTRVFKVFFREEFFNKHLVNVENVDNEDIEKVKRYIRGEKNSYKNDKGEKCNNDIGFRQSMGLETYYDTTRA